MNIEAVGKELDAEQAEAEVTGRVSVLCQKSYLQLVPSASFSDDDSGGSIFVFV